MFLGHSVPEGVRAADDNRAESCLWAVTAPAQYQVKVYGSWGLVVETMAVRSAWLFLKGFHSSTRSAGKGDGRHMSKAGWRGSVKAEAQPMVRGFQRRDLGGSPQGLEYNCFTFLC